MSDADKQVRTSREGATQRTPAAGKSFVSKMTGIKADVLSASREALQTPQVHRTMARAVFALGAALAFVAALSVHASLHAMR